VDSRNVIAAKQCCVDRAILTARLEAHATLPALDALRSALGSSLGIIFEPGKGEHLFRSTLIQTLFYGLFSAYGGANVCNRPNMMSHHENIIGTSTRG
jgi:hypothetical protein